jgi:anti-anti-sigma factor
MPASPQLEITRTATSSGVVVIALTGRFVLGPEGGELDAAVRTALAEGARKFVIDLGGISHIDSTGVGRCIAALNLVMGAGGDLALACGPGQVRDGFRVTQLDRVFQIFEDVPSAAAALN